MPKETYSNRNHLGFFDPTASRAIWRADRAARKQRIKGSFTRGETESFDLTLTYSFDGRRPKQSPSKNSLGRSINSTRILLTELRKSFDNGSITEEEFKTQREILVAKINQERNQLSLRRKRTP